MIDCLKNQNKKPFAIRNIVFLIFHQLSAGHNRHLI